MRSERKVIDYIPVQTAKQETIQEQNVKQDVKQETKIDIAIKTELPAIQKDFEDLKELLIEKNPKLERLLNEIGDSLDEVKADTEKGKLIKPMNKVGRFLKKLDDKKSEYHKIVSGTEEGIDLAQKLVSAYNKIAPLLGLTPVLVSLLGV